MTIDEAVAELKAKITSICASAAIKETRLSDEESRISVDAPAGDMAAIQDAVRDRTIQIMVSEGLDIQVFVYDKDAPKGVVG